MRVALRQWGGKLEQEVWSRVDRRRNIPLHRAALRLGPFALLQLLLALLLLLILLLFGLRAGLALDRLAGNSGA